jgi:hypothetical protein
VSAFTYFKEQKAMKFLDIVRHIINFKLSGSSPISFETA